MKPCSSLFLVAVALCACCLTAPSAALEVARLLQAEFAGQKIGSRTYSAEGVSWEPVCARSQSSRIALSLLVI